MGGQSGPFSRSLTWRLRHMLRGKWHRTNKTVTLKPRAAAVCRCAPLRAVFMTTLSTPLPKEALGRISPAYESNVQPRFTLG